MQAQHTLDNGAVEPQAAEQTDMIRVRWPIAALAIPGLLVAALVAAFVLARPAQAPTASPAVPTMAAAQPQSAATTVPEVAPATVVPTRAPAPTVAAPVAASPSPTVDPVLAREVGAAYERYWAIRSEALLNLDPSKLPDVMADEELVGAQRYIQRLQSEGHAVRTDVTLNYEVVRATSTEAEVYDEYVSESVFVSPATKQPLESAPAPETLKVSHYLSKVGGVWRVAREQRYQ